MVGRDHVAGTGHILNDELGVAWNVLPQWATMRRAHRS